MARIAEVTAMRIAGLIGSIVLAGALGACAEHEQGATAPQGYTAASGVAAARTVCPLAKLTGVHATVSEIDKGVAITITEPKHDIDTIRDNVHAMADANDKQGNAFAACPCGATNAAAGATEAMPRPAADASVKNIETGAILKLTAKKDSDIDALRSFTHDDVMALKRSCLKERLEQEREREPSGR
jgi:hypothetical protein